MPNRAACKMSADTNFTPRRLDMDDEIERTALIAPDDEEESDLSALLSGTLSDLVASMDQEQAEALLATLFEGGEIDTSLFAHVTPQVTPTMTVTDYRPDQAVREASLAKKDQWRPGVGEISYRASNALEVYLGTAERPLDLPQAMRHIRQLSESTVLTARILLGLWNTRRNNHRVSRNGSVAVLLDEILQWQGVQKHSREVHPGSSKRYTDGYRTEHKQRVIQDLALLASCNVRGTSHVLVKGKTVTLEVDGPYLRYSVVSKKIGPDDKVILGFLVSPGDWIGTYERNRNEALAGIDSQIFQLNPQNDRLALRLALFLTERWREQAKDGNFSAPIVMSDLLAASMIAVDERHLTNRFVPRIEAALEDLARQGILGKYLCLTSVDRTQGRWGKDWLASSWEILPPLQLIQEYQELNTTTKKRPARTRRPSEQRGAREAAT
jgi:hypothetical protein